MAIKIKDLPRFQDDCKDYLQRIEAIAVSYTHLTLPTIRSV